MDRLKELNRYFRSLRPHNPGSNYIDFFYTGNFLEIDFPNTCCLYDKDGCCTMCNYGTGNSITNLNIVMKQLSSILEKYKDKTQVILIGTNGSVLDTKNFQFDFLCEGLKVISTFPYNTVIFETHFSTITLPILQLLKELLPYKKIYMESGLESSNDIVQKYCYAKVLPLDFVKKKIQLIHKLEIGVYINVILGAPFLSVREQKQDCLDTIRWVLKHNCYPVIFPLNIKPFTTIEYMYQKNLYTPISLWMLFDILNSFSDNDLEYIDVTWYGNRLDEYVENDCTTIFPQTCCDCFDKLRMFFDKYNSLEKGSKRFRLLKCFLIENESCNCYKTYINSLSSSDASENIEKSVKYKRKRLFREAELDGLLTEGANGR